MLHVLFQGGGKLDERDEIPWVYVHWSFLYWVDTFSFLAHVLWRFAWLESNTLASFTHKLAFHAKHGSVHFQLRGPIVATGC